MSPLVGIAAVVGILLLVIGCLWRCFSRGTAKKGGSRKKKQRKAAGKDQAEPASSMTGSGFEAPEEPTVVITEEAPAKASKKASKKAKPSAEQPAEPSALQPAKPSAAKSAKPAAQPAKPPAAQPAKPPAAQPAKPSAAQPAKPSAAQPAKAAAAQPAKAAAAQPAKAAAAQPAKPSAAQPAKPAKPPASSPGKTSTPTPAAETPAKSKQEKTKPTANNDASKDKEAKKKKTKGQGEDIVHEPWTVNAKAKKNTKAPTSPEPKGSPSKGAASKKPDGKQQKPADPEPESPLLDEVGKKPKVKSEAAILRKKQKTEAAHLQRNIDQIKELEKRLAQGERLSGAQLDRLGKRRILEDELRELLWVMEHPPKPAAVQPPAPSTLELLTGIQPTAGKGPSVPGFFVPPSAPLPEWAAPPEIDWSADAPPPKPKPKPVSTKPTPMAVPVNPKPTPAPSLPKRDPQAPWMKPQPFLTSAYKSPEPALCPQDFPDIGATLTTTKKKQTGPNWKNLAAAQEETPDTAPEEEPANGDYFEQDKDLEPDDTTEVPAAAGHVVGKEVVEEDEDAYNAYEAHQDVDIEEDKEEEQEEEQEEEEEEEATNDAAGAVYNHEASGSDRQDSDMFWRQE